jgi:hypothetical protein
MARLIVVAWSGSRRSVRASTRIRRPARVRRRGDGRCCARAAAATNGRRAHARPRQHPSVWCWHIANRMRLRPVPHTAHWRETSGRTRRRVGACPTHVDIARWLIRRRRADRPGAEERLRKLGAWKPVGLRLQLLLSALSGAEWRRDPRGKVGPAARGASCARHRTPPRLRPQFDAMGLLVASLRLL